MRVLLLHNKYQYAGGEDKVFEAESELLSSHGHIVEQVVFDNREIVTALDKIRTGLLGIYNFRSEKLVARKIEQFNPDVVHIHNFVPLASPSVLFAARRFKIPAVLTLHNYRLICPSATLYYNNEIYEKSMKSLFPLDAVLKGVYRNSIAQTAALALMTSFHNIFGTWRNKVNKFIVLTEFAKSKFTESRLRVSPDQFMLKPNFIADPGNGNESREDFFLFVGRLSQEKGVDTLLNAFRSSSHRLVIIGDGPMQEQVEKFVHERRNIQYLGFQSKAAIMDHMKRAQALIIPSTWYEGFPITVLEAFATGTPVIGSKLGGIAEIVEDKFNGLLFEAGNKDSLRETIERFQSADRKELSENARKTYLDNYTPEKNYRTLMDIYTEAMKNNEHGK
jgi:glycosyltransferase involved in cell wall biosynthesis